MTEQAFEIVGKLDNQAAVKFLEFLGGLLLEGQNAEGLKSQVDASIRSSSEWTNLEGLTREQRRAKLPADVSIALARRTLEQFAADPGIAPVIPPAWQKYQEKRDVMFLDPFLGIGFVASMLLLVATTEFEGEILGVKFSKKVAPVELVREVAKAAFEAAIKVSTGG